MLTMKTYASVAGGETGSIRIVSAPRVGRGRPCSTSRAPGAYLEHGVGLNLVADRHPRGTQN
jgi:hypothetical protein